MNKETFIKRVDFVLTKKGTINQKWDNIFYYLRSLKNGYRVYPKKWNRNWNRFRLNDNSPKLEQILEESKIDYVTGNDSDKGGVQHDYYQLTSKGLRQVKDLDFIDILKNYQK